MCNCVLQPILLRWGRVFGRSWGGSRAPDRNGCFSAVPACMPCCVARRWWLSSISRAARFAGGRPQTGFATGRRRRLPRFSTLTRSSAAAARRQLIAATEQNLRERGLKRLVTMCAPQCAVHRSVQKSGLSFQRHGVQQDFRRLAGCAGHAAPGFCRPCRRAKACIDPAANRRFTFSKVGR